MSESAHERRMQAERADIQGIILSGYGHLPHASYIFFQVRDADAGRRWLADVVPLVTTAKEWRKQDGRKYKLGAALHVAFSYPGLTALGLPEETLASFPLPFPENVAARAEILGDTGESAPEHWNIGGPQQPPLHGVLVLYGETEARIDDLAGQQLRAIEATSDAVAPIAIEKGHRTNNGKEHFGFHDGISKPEIGDLVRHERGAQDTVATGEIILGHKNAYGLYPTSPIVPAARDPHGLLPPFSDGALPDSRDFGRNGSYLVYRKLAQDVAGFWNFLEHQAAGEAPAMLQLGAKLVGRWPGGAPITLAPEADDATLADENAFLFMRRDPKGLRCPIGSHIRRANPRDSRVNDTPVASLQTSGRHRLVRRGMLYGAPLFPPNLTEYPNAPKALRDDGRPRGLQFFCICADIARQFEFVQQTWCNSATFDAEFATKDPIIGNNDGTGFMTLPAEPFRRRIARMPRFVRVRGGGYFFLPGMAALRYIAKQ